MNSLLSDTTTYKPIKSNPLPKMQSAFNSGLSKIGIKYPDDKEFVTKFKSFLPGLPYAYGLPKVHKPGAPLRPIISNRNSASYKLAKRLSNMLSPILGSFSGSHLRHNGDLINKLKNIDPTGQKFISFDVQSLFTNVPVKPTLDFLAKELPKLKTDFPISTPCLIDLIELCLRNSFFRFNDQFFEQTFGFAMGSPLSPILANIFLEHVEKDLLPLYTGVQPTLWLRYVDDVLALIPADFCVDSFGGYINSLYPTLNFTWEWESEGIIPFLDVKIHKCTKCLRFSIYRKPTNSESYLHYFSFHPVATKLSVAQGFFLRALRVCDQRFLDD